MRQLLALFAMLVCLALLQAAEKQQVEKNAVDSKAEHREGDTTNAQALNKGNHSPCCEKKPKQNWWQKLWTDPIATFTGLLALVTGGLICVGVRQEIHLRETSRRDLRAYLAVDDVFCPFQNQRESIIVGSIPRLKIKNFGKTPAMHITVRLGGIWFSNEGRFERRYKNPDYVGPKFNLAPTQTYETRFSKDVFDFVGGMSKKENGDEPFFFGSIIYTDIYGRWWRHDFCYHYDCKPDSPNNRFIPHNRHYGENEDPYPNERIALPLEYEPPAS